MNNLSRAAVLALLFASQLFSATISQDFAQVLSGAVQLDQVTLDSMYAQFQSENQTPASKFYDRSASERKAAFEESVMRIQKHNSEVGQTWFKGVNEYSDMTEEEFFDYFNIRENQNCSATMRPAASQNIEEILRSIPASWNWQDYGMVSPVKNQGKCGSCWTFSTVGAMEAHFLLKYGQFRNLSEQQLVDCAGAFDNNGCGGGLPSHAFEYINYAQGLTTEDEYPYKAVDQTCQLQDGTQSVGVVGGSFNVSTNEVDLAHALFDNGPISVCFQVIGGFRDYTSGVYGNSTCKNGTDNVNHAVLAVGYGTLGGLDYWYVKNSWGAAWGDKGYFKILRGTNMCGIAMCNSYPIQVVDLTLGTKQPTTDQSDQVQIEEGINAYIQ